MLPSSTRGRFSSPSSSSTSNSRSTSNRSSPSLLSPPTIAGLDLENPTQVSFISRLSTGVGRIDKSYRPTSSNVLWDTKEQEFFGFCDYKYASDAYKYQMTADKCYLFLFYHAFRDQKAKVDVVTKIQLPQPPPPSNRMIMIR